MGETYAYEIRVPRDRVAVIIGHKGTVKRALSEQAKVQMEIDSDEGMVTLTSEDSIALFTAREMIKAIGRGFNPDVAQLLLRQDYVLEQLDLSDYANTKDSVARLKGRVIGMKGKGREHVEKLSDCFVSVYGKTVCIIGEMQKASVAKRAVEMLLEGAMHATVWRYLEKMRRKLREEEGGL